MPCFNFLSECCPPMYVFKKDARPSADKRNCKCPNMNHETQSLYPLFDDVKPMR